MDFDRVIIDADSLLYRCGFAAEGEPVSHALHNLKNQIQVIMDDTGAKSHEIFIKGVGNFRDTLSVSTTYKGTRSRAMPEHYHALRDYIIGVHGAMPVDGMEADDYCSVRLYEHYQRDSKVIIASIDKDLWNTPGWHYNYHPSNRRITYVTPNQADRNFLVQLLTGDKSDNVPGLPFCADATILTYDLSPMAARGCGVASAKKMLQGKTNKDALLCIWDAYDSMGLQNGMSTEEVLTYFVEQGKLLWMTRKLTPAGQPILWEIPEVLNDHIKKHWRLV